MHWYTGDIIQLCHLIYTNKFIVVFLRWWQFIYAVFETISLIVYSTVCSGGDQRQHQSSASLAFGEFAGDWWIPRTKVQKREKWWRHHVHCSVLFYLQFALKYMIVCYNLSLKAQATSICVMLNRLTSIWMCSVMYRSSDFPHSRYQETILLA